MSLVYIVFFVSLSSFIFIITISAEGESIKSKDPSSIVELNSQNSKSKIINFRKTNEKEKEDYVKSINGKIIKKIEKLDAYIVELPNDEEISYIPKEEFVEIIEPDFYVQALVQKDKEKTEKKKGFKVNDPLYKNQWALHSIDVEKVWEDNHKNSDKITVAVIDSGICMDHPDLKGRILPGYDFIEDDSDPQDEFDHGCSVAGIIAANTNNKIGIAGISQNTMILPLRVLDGNGIGTYSDLAEAIVYAVDNDAKVINLSLGGQSDSEILKAAIEYATSKNVTIVAAAGNTGNDSILYPAKYEEVISVGSVGNPYESSYQVSDFSSRSQEIDIWAPGEDILSTSKDNNFKSYNGTSYSSAFITGLILTDSLDLLNQIFLDVNRELKEEIKEGLNKGENYNLEINIDNREYITDKIKSLLEKELDYWTGEIPESKTFQVVHLRWEENWAIGSITPKFDPDIQHNTDDDHAHIDIDSENFVLSRNSKGDWVAALPGSTNLTEILSYISNKELGEGEKKALFDYDNDIIHALTTQQFFGYKLPWSNTTNTFYITRTCGWHTSIGENCAGSSLDFANNSTNIPILSPVKGQIYNVCPGADDQLMVSLKPEIPGSPGNYYNEIIRILHLDKNRFNQLGLQVGDTINLGENLGTAISGYRPQESNCYMSTSVDNLFHIHVDFPLKPFIIDDYTLGGGSSLVITDSNNNTVARNSLQSTNYPGATSSIPRNNTDFPDTRSGDFNGDEKDDVIYATPGGGFYVTLSGYDQNNVPKFIGSNWLTFWEPLQKIQWDIGDLTADGKDDLVIAFSYQDTNKTYFFVYPTHSAGNLFDVNHFAGELQGLLPNFQWDVANVSGTDSDNKQRDDIVIATQDNNFYVFKPVNSTGTYDHKLWTINNPPGTLSDSSWRIARLDNNDKMDIVLATSGNDYYGLFSTGSSFNQLLIWNHGGILSDYEWNIGDFGGINNQGDIVVVSPSNTFYVTYYDNSLNKFVTNPWIIYTAYPRSQTRWEILKADNNGHSDILLVSPQSKFHVYYSNGTGIGDIKAMEYDTPLNQADFKLGNFDADSNGTDDIAFTIGDNRTFVITTSAQGFYNSGLWMDRPGSLSEYEWKVGNYYISGSTPPTPDLIFVRKSDATFVVSVPNPQINPPIFTGWNWMWLDHSGGGPLANNEWR